MDPGETAAEIVNLMADRLSYSAIVPISGRSMNSSDVYNEIDRIYQSNLQAIQAALTP